MIANPESKVLYNTLLAIRHGRKLLIFWAFLCYDETMLAKSIAKNNKQKEMPMKGNVQLASDKQFDELRICLEKSFNKLRGRLGRDTAQGWIGDSPALDEEVAKILLGRSAPNYPVWKTIRLGTGIESGDEFIDELEAVDVEVGIGTSMACYLRSEAFKAETEEREVDLVRISVAELGFTDRHTPRKKIYQQARRFGLALCPSEVGPQLRLQYMDQPTDEDLWLAMEPIGGPDGGVLCVYREWARYENQPTRFELGMKGGIDGEYYSKTKLVFIKPRPMAAK